MKLPASAGAKIVGVEQVKLKVSQIKLFFSLTLSTRGSSRHLWSLVLGEPINNGQLVDSKGHLLEM